MGLVQKRVVFTMVQLSVQDHVNSDECRGLTTDHACVRREEEDEEEEEEEEERGGLWEWARWREGRARRGTGKSIGRGGGNGEVGAEGEASGEGRRRVPEGGGEGEGSEQGGEEERERLRCAHNLRNFQLSTDDLVAHRISNQSPQQAFDVVAVPTWMDR